MLAAAVFVTGPWVQPARAASVLQNGGMEDPFSSNVATPWTYYSGGTITGASQARETTIVHGPVTSQKLAGNAGNNAANLGIRQAIDASVGDAFTFGGWVYPDAVGNYLETSIRVAWGGGISATTATALSTLQATSAQRRVWNQMPLAGGNATASSITVFLHSRRNAQNGTLLTYWDDVVGYHAYVPPAPSVINPTTTTLTVDVNPGSNVDNVSAEYAVSVSGLGWVQEDGSVGPLETAFWRTEADWDSHPVTGLTPDTTYDFEVVARYSGTITQATLQQGFIGSGKTLPVPEPATLGFLVLGGVAVLRGRKR